MIVILKLGLVGALQFRYELWYFFFLFQGGYVSIHKLGHLMSA